MARKLFQEAYSIILNVELSYCFTKLDGYYMKFFHIAEVWIMMGREGGRGEIWRERKVRVDGLER